MWGGPGTCRGLVSKWSPCRGPPLLILSEGVRREDGGLVEMGRRGVPRLSGHPWGGGARGAVVFRFVRVGACADELRLMGAGRSEVSTEVFEVEGGRGSLVRNSSSARVPPDIERIRRGPCGEGANCTMQFVERGGRLRDRRCALAGRFLATKGRRS